MLLYGWLKDSVKQKGSAKALIYRDTYLSWRGLLHRVDRRAREFTQMGVRPGDLVGLMLGNVPDFIILSLALSKLEAAPVPLDPTTSTRELEMLMSLVPLRGMITRPRGGDAPLPTASPTKDGERQAPESRRRLQGTLLSCSIYPTEKPKQPRKKADQVAVVLITTDSAGDPKPVERTAGNLTAEAAALIESLGLNGEDRALLTVPLFQAFGFDLGMVACFSCGAALYLEDEIAAARIIKLVREQEITVLPGNQSMFSELGHLPAARPLSHKPIRLLSLGGGLSGAALEGFCKRYGVKPLSCFHTTETGALAIDAKGQAGETVGKLLPGIEHRVTNQKTGKQLPSGRKGVLWVRSEAISPLKLVSKRQNASRDVLVGGRDEEGWYRTGDLVCVDRSKRLTLKGREDDVVRVEGKQVALGEVEGCIESLPKVSAAQAQLITDPLGGPMVIAKVVMKESLEVDAEEIIDHCARNLAPYKVPRRIEFCDSLG
jgi:acyl-CoA synthetase (AMP-forming)/AMP-acid ligase II